MSRALEPVDLHTAVVGSSGRVSWTRDDVQAGGSTGLGAGQGMIRLYNESGCGLQIVFANGTSDRCAAGQWHVYPIPAGSLYLSYTVEYVLPGANVSLLLATVYGPGEMVPTAPTLGNSPVGVGGTVQTGTNVGQANEVIYDSTAINGETPGTVSSIAAASGGVPLVDVTDDNPTGGKRRFVMASGEADVNADGSVTAPAFHGPADSAASAGTVPASGVTGTLPASQVGTGYPAADLTGSVPSATQLEAAGGSQAAVVANYGGSGPAHGYLSFPYGGGTLTGHKAFGGVGAGTFTHGISVVPDFVGITTTEGNSTETVGVDSLGTSTVHVNQGVSGWPWLGIATKN